MKRRDLLLTGAVATAAVSAVASRASAAEARRKWSKTYSGSGKQLPPGEPNKDYRPTITPDGSTLPFEVVDGVKVYHLVAEEVPHEFAPGLKGTCWGYNGRVHGPTIEAVEGDRVRVYVTNRLPAPTTVHWHGVFLPSGMDGVGGLSQPDIMPGETFVYEWTFRQHGTYMYHSHHDEKTQMAMGLMGMMVVHPRDPHPSHLVDKDFVIMLSEWEMKVGAKRPNPNAMGDFNVLTMNAKAFPGTSPLVCKTGDRVRIRFGNLSAMDHHPIHLHGYAFKIVATDGGDIPLDAQWPETTVLVATGSTRTIEFIADEPGDWSMHCHMTHHVMNQMGHGIPNMLGSNARAIEKQVRPLEPRFMTMGDRGMGDMATMDMPVPDNSIPMKGGQGPRGVITMGGMFTIVKVRDQINGQADPGWYENPPEEQARLATADELKADGIDV